MGVKWGAGVLVTHILDEAGKESWSAPVLYKVHEMSLGLLAGACRLAQLRKCVACKRLNVPMRLPRQSSTPACACMRDKTGLRYAGVGNIQTVLILGSERAVDQFRVGARKGPVVLGQDLSLGQTLGFDVIEDRNIFATRDVLTHSLADGVIADWSLIGAAPAFCSVQIPSCISSSTSSRILLCLLLRQAARSRWTRTRTPRSTGRTWM